MESYSLGKTKKTAQHFFPAIPGEHAVRIENFCISTERLGKPACALVPQPRDMCRCLRTPISFAPVTSHNLPHSYLHFIQAHGTGPQLHHRFQRSTCSSLFLHCQLAHALVSRLLVARLVGNLSLTRHAREPRPVHHVPHTLPPTAHEPDALLRHLAVIGRGARIAAAW